MANEIYDSTWWGNTIQTASSIGTSTEMIQGQFNLTKLGDELITNGGFDTDSDWIEDNGWTISGGLLNCNNSLSNNTRQLISSHSTDKKYIITYTVSNYVSGGVEVKLGYANGVVRNANGTYTEEMTFIDGGVFNGYLRIFSDGASELSIDNVSVKEVRAEEVEAVKCLADAIHRIGIQDIQN